MGGINDQITLPSEHGATEIQSLFHIDTRRCLLQHNSHLFCNRCKMTAENLELNGVLWYL